MKITGHILFYYDIRSKFFQVVLWFSIFISHGTQKLLFWIIWMHSCMRCANSCNSARMYENYQAFLQTDYQFTTNTYAKYMRGKKKSKWNVFSSFKRQDTFLGTGLPLCQHPCGTCKQCPRPSMCEVSLFRRMKVHCWKNSKGFNGQFGKVEVFLCYNIATIHSKNNTSNSPGLFQILFAGPSTNFIFKKIF